MRKELKGLHPTAELFVLELAIAFNTFNRLLAVLNPSPCQGVNSIYELTPLRAVAVLQQAAIAPQNSLIKAQGKIKPQK